MLRGRGLELKHMNFWNSYMLELQHLVVYANNLKNKWLFNCELLLLSPCEYLNFIFCSLSLPQNGEDSGQRGIFIVYMTYHPPKVMASKSKLVWSHIFCGSGDLGQLGWVPLSTITKAGLGKESALSSRLMWLQAGLGSTLAVAQRVPCGEGPWSH